MRRTEMTGQIMADLIDMQTTGRLDDFYRSRVWKNKREQVLKLDHYQCTRCGKPVRGKSAIVHHVAHLSDRLDLALSVEDPVTGARQLVTVCKDCHEALHPEALRVQPAKPPLTVERWE